MSDHLVWTKKYPQLHTIIIVGANGSVLCLLLQVTMGTSGRDNPTSVQLDLSTDNSKVSVPSPCH